MNTILMAAARGARIEIRYFDERTWNRTYSIDINGGSAAPDATYRIHPDDEHMRFGPISSALRKSAENVNYFTWSVKSFLELGAISEYTTSARSCGSNLQRSLFMLILSEALADEGL